MTTWASRTVLHMHRVLSELTPDRVCVSDLRSADEEQTGRPQKKDAPPTLVH